MVKLSPVVLNLLGISPERNAFMSKENCWWFLTEDTIPKILTDSQKFNDIYEQRKAVFELNLMGTYIGIPTKDTDNKAIETIRYKNYFTIYLDKPPKFL